MIKQLPRWVEYGGFLLALLAGSINAVGLLEFHHQAVSHLTGASSLLGVRLGYLDFAAVFQIITVLAGFVLGATISGVLLEHPALKMGRHYSSVLLLEGCLLCLAIYTLEQHSDVGHYLASAACGMQNAMVTTYSGAVIRTTHLTGMFTDLGLMIGARLRGVPFDRRRALLYVILISGFISGSLLGGLLFRQFALKALWLPVSLAFGMAIAYWIYFLSIQHTARKP